ncbi:MAG: signal peptidase I [Filifactor alocis]|nr:signal peptidase I [Filifactor alocis]
MMQSLKWQAHKRSVVSISGDRNYRKFFVLLLMVLAVSAVPVWRTQLNNVFYVSLFYWGSILFMMSTVVPGIHIPGRETIRSSIRGYAIMGAIVYIAINFIIGVLLKQLKATPYDISPKGILLNLMIIIPGLLAREKIRAYGLGTIWRTSKYRRFAVVVFTLFMALTEVHLGKVLKLGSTEDIVMYLLCDVLVIFARNYLMSVLVFYGGSQASILYFGILRLFEKCFPFLPEIPWIATGAIGIMFPIFFGTYLAERSAIEKAEKRQEDPKGDFGYIAILTISILFSWFSVGVFNVYPSTVLTGSMEPMIYPGDVILIQKMLKEEDVESLKKGDVINFQRGKITITHRVEEVLKDEAGNISFVTKGDNNKSRDEQIVLPNDVKGIVVQVVPKIGIPILLVKSGEAIPEGVIDYEEGNNGK